MLHGGHPDGPSLPQPHELLPHTKAASLSTRSQSKGCVVKRDSNKESIRCLCHRIWIGYSRSGVCTWRQDSHTSRIVISTGTISRIIRSLKESHAKQLKTNKSNWIYYQSRFACIRMWDDCEIAPLCNFFRKCSCRDCSISKARPHIRIHCTAFLIPLVIFALYNFF